MADGARECRGVSRKICAFGPFGVDAYLSKSNLFEADLSNANFKNTMLVEADLSVEDIAEISDTYHAWKGGKKYEDVTGFCKSVTIENISVRDTCSPAKNM